MIISNIVLRYICIYNPFAQLPHFFISSQHYFPVPNLINRQVIFFRDPSDIYDGNQSFLIFNSKSEVLISCLAKSFLNKTLSNIVKNKVVDDQVRETCLASNVAIFVSTTNRTGTF